MFFQNKILLLILILILIITLLKVIIIGNKFTFTSTNIILSLGNPEAIILTHGLNRILLITNLLYVNATLSVQNLEDNTI